VKRGQQLNLNVRFYRVGVRGFPDMQVQAPSRSAAKYQIFKLAREAGYFTKMRDFLSRVSTVREVRR